MERKLKERMLDESRFDPGLKEAMWERIEAQLDIESPAASRSRTHAKRTQRSRKTMRRIKISTGLAAAVIAGAVFLTMPAGTAFMKDVRSWFAPEKKVEVNIEGEKEQTNQKLHESGKTNGEQTPGNSETSKETSRYVIYYDQERYKLEQQGGKDVITTTTPLPDKYPEVSFTIEQRPGIQPADAAADLEKQLAAGYAEVRKAEQVTEPIAGYRIYAQDGKDWNSKVMVVYVVDNGKQGSFVLTEKYFLEASEGHGSRFDQMLKEFKVLSE
ncbi:anti-sigma factor [Cohnella pontilimi]|uniref:Anti-sigma factor n=1 Tax=Cohnella pontilimi TaxID=2564100 RepID=A0A4U0F9Y4_9BACL|nr:anti-sigma factor [Cohnella pontilimi]TJY41576.1 anti-sigma factor [Cohnella pontilimi]